MQYLHRILLAVFLLCSAAVHLSASDTLVCRDQPHFRQWLRDKSAGEKGTRVVIIRGSYSRSEWKHIMTSLSSFRSLEEIIFQYNELRYLPAGISSLIRLKRIVVADNPEIQTDSVLSQLAALPGLSRAMIQVESEADIYDVPASIDKVEELYLVSTELPAQKGFSLLEQIPDDFEVWNEDYLLDKNNETDQFYSVTCVFEKLDAEPSTNQTSAVVVRAENCRTGEIEPFEREYQHVVPPLENMEVGKEVYLIEPNAQGTITYPESGTRISVPANAFVDKNGNPVTEPVAIDYREFREPLDFVISGIPMSQINGDSLSFFQSSGMFEINASVNGEEVFLAPDKNITIDFVRTDDQQSDFWYFDDSSNTWVERNDMVQRTGTVQAVPDSLIQRPTRGLEAAQRFYYTVKFAPDSTGLNERFEDPSYTNRYRESEEKSKPLRIPLNDGSSVRADRLVRIRGVKRTSEGEVVFTLSASAHFFPELSRFKGYQWMVPGETDSRAFRKTWSSRRGFSDVRLVPSGESVIIQLKGEDELFEIVAIPCIRREQDGIVSYEKATPDFRPYQKTIARRVKVFNKKAINGKFPFDKVPFKDDQQKISYSRKKVWRKLNEREKRMSEDEWSTYFTRFIQANTSSGATLTADYAVVQTMNISGFGIYNCDQIMQIPNPANVLAGYKSESGPAMFPSSAFVFIEGVNGCLVYNGYQQYSPYKFALDRTKTVMILACQDGKAIGVIRQAGMADITFLSNNSYEFTLEEIPAEVSTPEQLRAFLRL